MAHNYIYTHPFFYKGRPSGPKPSNRMMKGYEQTAPGKWQKRSGMIIMTVQLDERGYYWPQAYNLKDQVTEKAFAPEYSFAPAARRADRLAKEAQGIQLAHNLDPDEHKAPKPTKAAPEEWPKTKGRARQKGPEWEKTQNIDIAKFLGCVLVAKFDEQAKNWMSEVWDRDTGQMVWQSRTPCSRARAWGLATRAAKRHETKKA